MLHFFSCVNFTRNTPTSRVFYLTMSASKTATRSNPTNRGKNTSYKVIQKSLTKDARLADPSNFITKSNDVFDAPVLRKYRSAQNKTSHEDLIRYVSRFIGTYGKRVVRLYPNAHRLSGSELKDYQKSVDREINKFYKYIGGPVPKSGRPKLGDMLSFFNSQSVKDRLAAFGDNHFDSVLRRFHRRLQLSDELKFISGLNKKIITKQMTYIEAYKEAVSKGYATSANRLYNPGGWQLISQAYNGAVDIYTIGSDYLPVSTDGDDYIEQLKIANGIPLDDNNFLARNGNQYNVDVGSDLECTKVLDAIVEQVIKLAKINSISIIGRSSISNTYLVEDDESVSHEQFDAFSARNETKNPINIRKLQSDSLPSYIEFNLRMQMARLFRKGFNYDDSNEGLVVGLEITVHKLTLAGGRVKSGLPEELENRRALVSIDYDDDNCFTWALLRAKFGAVNLKNYKDLINMNDIELPVQISDLAKFESNNIGFPVSVLTYSPNKSYSVTNNQFVLENGEMVARKSMRAVNREFDYLYISNIDADKSTKLLLYDGHYYAVKNLSKLMVPRKMYEKKSSSYRACTICLEIFHDSTSLTHHKKLCIVSKFGLDPIIKPNLNPDIVFSCQQARKMHPVSIYFDFEAAIVTQEEFEREMLKNVNFDFNGFFPSQRKTVEERVNTLIENRQIMISFAIQVVSRIPTVENKSYSYIGENAGQVFLDTLFSIHESIFRVIKKSKTIKLTLAQKQDAVISFFELPDAEQNCEICQQKILESENVSATMIDKTIKVGHVECIEVCKYESTKSSLSYSALQHQSANHAPSLSECYCCRKPLYEVLDDGEIITLNSKPTYDPITGELMGYSHLKCWAAYNREIKFVPVIAHNGSGYDWPHLFRALSVYERRDVKKMKIKLIAKSAEKYQSFTIKYKGGGLKFIDSYAFLPGKLDGLVADTYKDSKTDTTKDIFKCTKAVLGDDQRLFAKGLCPYRYIKFDNLKANSLPGIEWFDNVSQKQYEFAKEMWTFFGCKNFGDYVEKYNILDTCLLADSFEHFRDSTFNLLGLDPAFFLGMPNLSMPAALLQIKDELQGISDPEIYKIVLKKCIRGGISQICQRYARANNPYQESYNSSIAESYIAILDMISMYPTAQCGYLPTGEFKMVESLKLREFMEIPEDSPIGYFIEVDCHCPQKLHQRFSDYPLLPETKTVDSDMIKSLNLKSSLEIDTVNQKLICDLTPKKNYWMHYRTFQFVVKMGYKIDKIHSQCIQFRQSRIFKQFIEDMAEIRARPGNSELQKKVPKLALVSLYGKCLTNPEKFNKSLLTTNQEDTEKCFYKPGFNGVEVIGSELCFVKFRNLEIESKYPVAIGAAVLELSKLSIYKMYYELKDYFESNGSKISYLGGDTDSLFVHITTKDLFGQIRAKSGPLAEIAHTMMPPHSGFDQSYNNGVLGKFSFESWTKKTETIRDINPIEFVGVTSKSYSFKYEYKSGYKYKQTLKGVSEKCRPNHERYLKCVFENMQTTVDQQQFLKKKHQIFTATVTKVALQNRNDKRAFTSSGVFGLPYGLRDAAVHCDQNFESDVLLNEYIEVDFKNRKFLNWRNVLATGVKSVTEVHCRIRMCDAIICYGVQTMTTLGHNVDYNNLSEIVNLRLSFDQEDDMLSLQTCEPIVYTSRPESIFDWDYEDLDIWSSINTVADDITTVPQNYDLEHTKSLATRDRQLVQKMKKPKILVCGGGRKTIYC